ncbi:MAG: hypothetical protein JSW59_08930, partial [Phycisphaerales bacterium]
HKITHIHIPLPKRAAPLLIVVICRASEPKPEDHNNFTYRETTDLACFKSIKSGSPMSSEKGWQLATISNGPGIAAASPTCLFRKNAVFYRYMRFSYAVDQPQMDNVGLFLQI